jgi:hypothetical protein
MADAWNADRAVPKLAGKIDLGLLIYERAVRSASNNGLISDFAASRFRANCRHLGQFHLTGSDRYPRFRVSNFAQSPSIER